MKFNHTIDTLDSEEGGCTTIYDRRVKRSTESHQAIRSDPTQEGFLPGFAPCHVNSRFVTCTKPAPCFAKPCPKRRAAGAKSQLSSRDRQRANFSHVSEHAITLASTHTRDPRLLGTIWTSALALRTISKHPCHSSQGLEKRDDSGRRPLRQDSCAENRVRRDQTQETSVQCLVE